MRLARLYILVAAILAELSWSIPAPDRFFSVTQPDGSTIEIRNRGNEFSHFTETRDKKVVSRDSKGYFRPSKRDTTRHFHQLDSITTSPSQAPSALAKFPSFNYPSIIKKKNTTGEQNILVVLVQFKDTKFINSDPKAEITRILTEEGYHDNNSMGSVADYFKDNSQGKFIPKFDIVGPVTLSGNNYSVYGPKSRNGDYGAQVALGEALDTLKKQGIDFNKYDNNGDNYLDYVHMIYAGFGSHDSNQDSAIWPHRWIFVNEKNLGTRQSPLYINEYACNAERDGISSIYDWRSKKLFGVGNFIHEFGHLMGLPDLYPTNNDTTLYTPSAWDVMDLGSYNTNNERGPIATSPPYYSTYERITLGWMTPDPLKIGADTLYGIHKNSARKLQNPKNSNEYFLMEYRDTTKWDKFLPNHGMLIWHIDYNRSAWDNAAINNSTHLHVDIEEADGIASTATRFGDSFPGSKRVTSYDKFITWSSQDLNVSLNNIKESPYYNYATFNVLSKNDTVVAFPSSSSVEISVESSSSVAAPASSSGADMDSTSAQPAVEKIIPDFAKPEIHLSADLIQIAGMPTGVKSIRIFDVNGNLQSGFATTNATAQIKLPRQGIPAILCISRGKTLLYTQRIH